MLDCTFAYGLSFLFPIADTAVGHSLRNHGEFARTELDFLVDSAGPAGTFLDIGANIGAVALPFAKRRPDWTVLAVEAHRGLASVLSANALNNRLYNVEVIHAAAGGEGGLVDFPAAPLSDVRNFGTMGFHERGIPTEPVRMLTLDELAPADTRLVKMDVEGFEPQVLKGAAKLLEKRQTIWLAEATTHKREAATQVIRVFQEAGYAVHWFYAPFATSISEKGPPADPTQGDANVVALPPGTPNAWALPPVLDPEETRPGFAAAYPYLMRYGYR